MVSHHLLKLHLLYVVNDNISRRLLHSTLLLLISFIPIATAVTITSIYHIIVAVELTNLIVQHILLIYQFPIP